MLLLVLNETCYLWLVCLYSIFYDQSIGASKTSSARIGNVCIFQLTRHLEISDIIGNYTLIYENRIVAAKM